MPYKKAVTKKSKSVISENLRAFFVTGERKKGDTELFFLSGELQPIWNAVKKEIMSDWIRENPGIRPWAWWEFDAPKEAVPGWDYSHFDSPQRRRLGGTGIPSHEVLNVWGGFTRGIPNSWQNQNDDDPPVFESEAAYLDRYGLLTKVEKDWLAEHPEAMEPECLSGSKEG